MAPARLPVITAHGVEDIVDELRYPIGGFVDPGRPSEAQRQEWIEQLAQAPRELRRAIEGLSADQLDTPYRDGGWTIRQVVHHVPDSHMNSYVRMKLAVTEDAPAIRTYKEELWAEFPEAKHGPVDMSLALLDALHRRW